MATEKQFDELNSSLVDIVNAIDTISTPRDEFTGSNMADHLYQITHYLRNISESLEKIANK